MKGKWLDLDEDVDDGTERRCTVIEEGISRME